MIFGNVVFNESDTRSKYGACPRKPVRQCTVCAQNRHSMNAEIKIPLVVGVIVMDLGLVCIRDTSFYQGALLLTYLT